MPSTPKGKVARAPLSERVKGIVAELARLGSVRVRDEMMPRYGIDAKKAFGVPVSKIKLLSKRLGRDRVLADALWRTGVYEARLLAAFVDEPESLTPARMDRWCRDFDNWAVTDHACFHSFDRSPHAFGRIAAWSRRTGEFQRRAAFALLASVALHDKTTPDAPFRRCLPLAERAAADERNFVKKGVVWALRGVARRSAPLHSAVVALARRLAAADGASKRWIGKDVLRELRG